jgi:hypothetical protein
MSFSISSFPHQKMNVVDESAYNPSTPVETLPIHQPVYIAPFPMGEPHVPVYCRNISVARNRYGAEAFNPANKKYYTVVSKFLEETFPTNGAWLVRAVDDKATRALSLLCAAVKINQNIPQWEVDPVTGNFAKDTLGNKIPVMDPANPENQLFVKGATIRFLVMDDLVELHNMTVGSDPDISVDLTAVERIIDVLTAGDFDTNPLDGTEDEAIVPILLFCASSPGALGNDFGWSIEYDKKENSADAVGKRNAFIYKFKPVRKKYGTNQIVEILSRYNAAEFSCALTDDAMDSTTKQKFTLDYVLRMSYPQDDAPLGMDIFPLYDNIKLLAAIVAPYEDTIPELPLDLYYPDGTPKTEYTNAEMDEALNMYYGAGLFNLFGLRDPDGKVYTRIVSAGAADVAPFIYPDSRTFLKFGSDGDIFNKNVLQDYIVDYLNLNIYPQFQDQARYPITHVFDAGYRPDVKYAMLDFMALRDDVNPRVTTYIHPSFHSDPKWTGITSMLDDLSFGISLHTRALLTRESVEKNTPCCRASIYTQAGFLEDSSVPMTTLLWRAKKYAEYENQTRLGTAVRGTPQSIVDMFTGFTWVPHNDDLKKLTWVSGLNYCQYLNHRQIHFAGLRSVYVNETSVLFDEQFSDVITYIKHVVRGTVASFYGQDQPVVLLQDNLKKEVEANVNKMLNNKYAVSATVYQTELDQNLGYVQRVSISIEAPAVFRVGLIDIICRRENFDPATANA